MLISVNTNKVIITNYDEINSGEYNIHPCEFTFSEEYNDLVRVAIFIINKEAYKVNIDNSTNTCTIPNEVLQDESVVTLGVYGYENIGDNLKLRYSPTPTTFFIHKGSYNENATTVLTPEKEQELEQLIAEVEYKLENGELNGKDGEDGYSPTITETATATGYDISITDVNGTNTFSIHNGTDGANGQDGNDGHNGRDGQDGYSPTATVTSTASGATISITDKNGTTTANITNGTNGTNGQDGYTPVRGTDYWTASDIAYMEQYCDTYIDGKNEYSNQEILIGTWFGENLYRKTVNITNPASGKTTIEHGIANIKHIIRYFGRADRQDSVDQLIPTVYTNWQIFAYDFTPTTFRINIDANQYNAGLSNLKIVMEYTKNPSNQA